MWIDILRIHSRLTEVRTYVPPTGLVHTVLLSKYLTHFTGYFLPDRLRGKPYFTVRDRPGCTTTTMMTHQSIGTYGALAVQYSAHMHKIEEQALYAV